tara:strand:+ start:603 stop:770 length:168 start_codon:yes stop_codon:yes gene_type:complete
VNIIKKSWGFQISENKGASIPFVVHHVGKNGELYWGHYFKTLEDAKKYLKKEHGV